MFLLRRTKACPGRPTPRRFASLPVMSDEVKLENLTLTEVPNRNFFFHLCESTATFAAKVLKVKVQYVSPGKLTLKMPFHSHLVGNPLPEALHGGAIAAAIDHAAGFACWSTFNSSVCSTLNMRIDYLKPLLFTDKSLLLDAFVEHIDDDKNILRATVVCYDGERSKQVAVGRALFNRYTPKLGAIDKVKPLFRVLWDTTALNFLGKAFLEQYQSLCMHLHKRKYQQKQKFLPIFSIEEEQEKYRFSASNSGAVSDPKIYNGLTTEEYIAVAEQEPVFGHEVLGLRVLCIAPGSLTMVMPFKEYFTGNFVTGVQHGGVTASLVDQAAGMCARSVVVDSQQRVSTVNLSIEYLAPAPCFEHIICEAKVVSSDQSSGSSGSSDSIRSSSRRGEGELIFVEATCWNESRTIVIAVAKLTFNVYTRKVQHS